MKIFKIIIPKQIIVLLSLILILSFIRIIIFGSFSLIYILWNIFLALLPFFISSTLLIRIKENKFLNPKVFWVLVVVWLFLLPNAPYLVTDLIHIGSVHNVPALYDAFLLFASAWVGILLFTHSLFHIEQVFKTMYRKNQTNSIIIAIIILTSFGMYLGRFLRFNSWDVLFNHSSFLSSMWQIFSSSSLRIEAILYTILFFIFILLSYISWKYTQNETIYRSRDSIK